MPIPFSDVVAFGPCCLCVYNYMRVIRFGSPCGTELWPEDVDNYADQPAVKVM